MWIEADYKAGIAKVKAKNELIEIGRFEMEKLPKSLFLPVINFLDGKHIKIKLKNLRRKN